MNENIRKPHVAGRFYTNNGKELVASMGKFFGPHPTHLEATRIKPLMAMLPHAGHVFSGAVTATTMAEIEFASRIIILCPNHTGQGKNFGVWASGAWETPIGLVPVDSFLAEKLMSDNSPFVADNTPHLQEHSIEVILPFLQYSVPILYMVPVSVKNLDGVEKAAQKLAACIREEKNEGKEVTILVSSDMNHFANDEDNRYKDNLALEAFLKRDPHALLKVVQEEKISMCGILPAIVGLLASNELGASQSKLASYDTSAKVSNNYTRVVGYAGAYVW